MFIEGAERNNQSSFRSETLVPLLKELWGWGSYRAINIPRLTALLTAAQIAPLAQLVRLAQPTLTRIAIPQFSD
jgi:hypothetical protein